jgi:hypothetical protein
VLADTRRTNQRGFGWARISYRTAIPLRPGREPLGLASADLVRDTAPEARVAHLDDGFDLVHGGRAEGRGCRRVALVGVWAAAKGVVRHLSALRVADDDQLRVRAAQVEAIDGRSHGCDAGSHRGVVGGAAAGRLAAAVGWSVLGFSD